MSDAIIHLDKIIDKLPDPDCCGRVVKLINYDYIEAEKKIKDRPNGLSCWFCDGCGATWSPVIQDEKLVFWHWIPEKEMFVTIDVLENGFKW